MLRKLGGAAAFVASLVLPGCISQENLREINELEKYLADIKSPIPRKIVSTRELEESTFKNLTSIPGTSIALAKKHRKNGFSISAAAYLSREEIPPEYALEYRDEFSFVDIIFIYQSSIRHAEISRQSTREIYGDNIVYKDFSDTVIPRRRSPPPIPKDLVRFINFTENLVRIENPERFKKEVFEQAKALGKSLEDIAIMSPRDVVHLVADITSRKMTYTNVDDNPQGQKFIKEHGKHLPHDRYFHLGKGDCDNYARIAQEIFGLFKKENPDLSGIHFASGYFLGGKKTEPHEYVSIIIPGEDSIICTMIDPTRYDTPEKKLNLREKYVNKRDYHNEFYRAIEVFDPKSHKTQPKTNKPNKKAVNRKQPKLAPSNNHKKQVQKHQTQNKSYKKTNYQTPRKVKVSQFNKRRPNNKRNK
jgi:hypothetical protein